MTTSGSIVRLASAHGRGFTTTVAVAVSVAAVAVMVTEVLAVTSVVPIVNVTAMDPAGTVIVAGIDRDAVFELERLTVYPPAGATPGRVKVPLALWPPMISEGAETEIGGIVVIRTPRPSYR
jgi:hypothetical protein